MNININFISLLDSYLLPGEEVVIGADASKDNLCVWVRSTKASIGQLKTYWEDVKELVELHCSTDLKGLKQREQKQRTRGARYHLLRLYADSDGVDTLLYLKERYVVRAIAMEPTGTAYTAIWSHICQQEEITIKWLGHAYVANYRRSNRLPNKNHLS